jgi:ribonuclease HI
MSNTTTASKNFLQEIPEEKKKLFELKFTVYTDGSCDPTSNNKPGGWAALLIDNKGKLIEMKGAEQPTTNNRMELLAIINSLKFLLENNPDETVRQYMCVDLYTDSTYCTNSIREWISKWIADGSLTNRPNSDLLLQAYELTQKFGSNLVIKWLPRNSTEELVFCDSMANKMRDSLNHKTNN